MFAPLQFVYHLPQRIGIAGGVVQFNDNVFSFNVASPTQSFPKAIQERIGLRICGSPKDAIDLCRLLRARHERTRSRAAEKRDELPPS